MELMLLLVYLFMLIVGIGLFFSAHYYCFQG